MKDKTGFEDDGRTIADMSGVSQQPMLMPGSSDIKSLKGRDYGTEKGLRDSLRQAEAEAAGAAETAPAAADTYYDAPDPYGDPEDAGRRPETVYLDKEERRAAIGGVMSAYLLVGGILFAAFAVVILVIGHLM